jgi:hypothetical protein
MYQDYEDLLSAFHAHGVKYLERNAAPVIQRSQRLQARFAFPAEPIAKHSQLPLPVPSQPVRTKQTVAITINGRNRPPALHGRAHNTVNIGHKPSAACSRIATQSFRLAGGCSNRNNLCSVPRQRS